MVWDVVLRMGVSLILGAAVGYGVAAIVNELSKAFAKLYEGFVGAIQQIWGYITEVTKNVMASIAQWMDENWAEIEDYLYQEIGYRRSKWLIAIFQEAGELIVGFIDPLNSQGSSAISLGVITDKNAQLPTQQNPLVHELELK